MERLTTMSLITGKPMLKALAESCGESACNECCEDYGEKDCEGCPVQEAVSKLAAYENKEVDIAKIYTVDEIKAYATNWMLHAFCTDAKDDIPENLMLGAFIHFINHPTDSQNIDNFLKRSDVEKYIEQSKNI